MINYSGYENNLWMPILHLININGNIEWICDQKLMCIVKKKDTPLIDSISTSE